MTGPKGSMHPAIIAQKTPDKPAIVMASTGERVTYLELEERSNRGAQLFRRLGLRTGDGIAIFMENHIRYLEICWAAQRAGLYYTCISSRLTCREVEYILRDCGARILIASSGLAKIAGEIAPLIPDVQLFMVGGRLDNYASYEDEAQAMPVTRIAGETAGMDMLYSSGTTGRPKGVRVPLSGMPIDTPSPLMLIVTGLFGMNEQTIYLSPAPLYHAAPLRYCMTVHRIGGTVIAMEHFDAEESLRLIEKYRATASQWVPTMFVRMLKLPDEVRTKYDISSMKTVIHAAAPCPVEVKRKMIEWWGPVLHEYYAGTEGNGFCYVNSADWLAHPGTVGKSLLGEIHICDDHGNELPVGEEGIVYFAGVAEFCYDNDEKRTRESRHPAHPDWS